MSNKEGRTARANRRIVSASRSSNFEQARREWTYTGRHLGEDEQGFPGVCELCGQPHVRQVFEIANEHTGLALWVGRQCVKHFVLKGAETPEESQRMFERRVMQDELLYGTLRPLAAIVLAGKADWEEVFLIQKAALQYLECRSAKGVREIIERNPQRWRQFIAAIAGVEKYEDLGRPDRILLRNAILEPKKVTKPPRVRFRNLTEREARALAARRSRAGGTQVLLSGIGRGRHTRPADHDLD